MYDGNGYFRQIGWVQIVRASFNGDAEEAMVDKAPTWQAWPIPTRAWGPFPTLFDAPSTTSCSVAWRADAFLTVIPDLLMSTVVRSVCSVQWGYDVSIDGSSRRGMRVRKILTSGLRLSRS